MGYSQPHLTCIRRNGQERRSYRRAVLPAPRQPGSNWMLRVIDEFMHHIELRPFPAKRERRMGRLK